MSVKTYDPKKVMVIFGGVEINGFAAESIVTVEPLGEGIKSIVGADGEVTRSMDPDRRHKITIKLSGSSSSNNYLSNVHAADIATGKGILPLLVRDLSGKTAFFAREAWVTKHPAVNRDKAAGTAEWVLETGAAELYVGGNN